MHPIEWDSMTATQQHWWQAQAMAQPADGSRQRSPRPEPEHRDNSSSDGKNVTKDT